MLMGILFFIMVVIGSFILGVLFGRFWEGKLIIDGDAVGGHSHGADDGHH